jgi:hypothetical protein
MTDSIAPESESQLALASRGPQGTASAEASSAAGSPSDQVSGGWDPSEVWLHRIELPRRRRAARHLTRSIL